MAIEKRKDALRNAAQLSDDLGIVRERHPKRDKKLNKRQLEQKLTALKRKYEWFRTLGGMRRLPIEENSWAVRILKEYDKRIQKIQDEINNL